MDSSIGEMKVFDEFELYGTIYASNKYKRGVDIEYVDGRKEKKTHAIYILRDIEGYDTIVKVGCTRCLDSRFHTMYRHVQNTTNDRIREFVKNTGSLSIYVYEVPTYTEDILGIDVRYSPVDDLERKILTEYKDRYDVLPFLNVVRR